MLAELRITPIGYRSEFARVVADVVRTVAASGLRYRVHAMGTTLEGDLGEILQVVRRCHEEVRKHADRALIELFVDDRSGAEGDLLESLERVRKHAPDLPLERLGRKEGG